MLNEKEEEWTDAEEKLSQPLIRPVWRMPISKGAELIREMSGESVRDLKVLLSDR